MDILLPLSWIADWQTKKINYFCPILIANKLDFSIPAAGLAYQWNFTDNRYCFVTTDILADILVVISIHW